MDFYSTRRRAAFAARLGAAAAVCAAAMSAQTFLMNPLTTAGVNQNGFRVYNVSAFTSYATVDNSWKQVVQSVTGTTLNNLPAYSTLSGVSTAFGYRTGGEDARTEFSIIYSPSFTYSVYGQGWSTMTHTLALSWNRKLAPRWHAFASLSGVTGNFDQILFSPNSEQNLASLSGTAEQLAGVVLGGAGANSAATAPSAAVAPQQRLFYGDRMLSAIAALGLSYSYSPRLSMAVTLTGNRMQHMGQNNIPADQSYYLVPATTDASAAVSLSYSLSPRTTVTGSATYGRTLSGFMEAQYTSAQLGMSRKLTRGWFVRLAGGGGYILPVTRISTNVRGKQYQASGGLGYRTHTHTFIASVDRAVTDYYGIGPAAVLSSGGGWSWQRLGSSWALQAGVSQDHLLGNQFAAAGSANNGFRANAGVYWKAYRHAAVMLQYAYVSFSGLFSFLPSAGQQLRFAQHSVRLSFGWGSNAPGTMQTGIAMP